MKEEMFFNVSPATGLLGRWSLGAYVTRDE
jgi:hypothetical protein